MKYNEQSRDYSLAYAKDKLKRVPLDLTKDKYNNVRAAAVAIGESVNGFIKQAIDERMERLGMIEPPEPEAVAVSDSETDAGGNFHFISDGGGSPAR